MIKIIINNSQDASNYNLINTYLYAYKFSMNLIKQCNFVRLKLQSRDTK